jgi:outer membrane protein
MFDLSKCATAAATALLLNSVGYSVTAVAENNTYYTLEQAVNYALDNNPSLQVMHERIAQAEAQLGEARASFYPQVKARLSYEHSDNPARAFSMIISQRRLDFGGTDFNHPGGVDNYRPEVIATYSLFNGGQDYQNKIAAELGVDAATLEESATRNQLIQSVTSAFYGVLAAKEAHKVAQRSIDAVKSELEQSRTRFEAGTVLKSDVLSLEVQLAEAQDAEIRAANAIELVEIAERKLSAAKGAHLPKADAYLSYGSDSKNLDYSTSRDNVTAGVQVEVDVFSGFRTSENVKKAERQLAEAQKIARKIQLDIENDVKTAYLKLQEALDRVKVTTVSVASAEEAFRLVSEQRQADVVTITRYIESEVARDEANSRVIAARYDALQAEAELNKALGNWK